MYLTAPVCFSTPYCGEEPVSHNLLSFHQCCDEVFGVSFVSSGQCLLCPKGNVASYILKKFCFVALTVLVFKVLYVAINLRGMKKYY